MPKLDSLSWLTANGVQKPLTVLGLAMLLLLLLGCSEPPSSEAVNDSQDAVEVVTETPAEDAMAEQNSDGADKPAEEDASCILSPPETATACTMQYDPVCGCDGKTYGNACMARGAGVPTFEPGECATGLD